MKLMGSIFAVAALALASSPALAVATPGETAPAFKLNDTRGMPVALADFKGKYVVVEWNNPNCPFVQKHYTSGNMQSLQQKLAGDQVAWIAINSTSQGHPDFLSTQQIDAWFKQKGGAPTAVLMDTSGEVARAFGARATPHMFVIDPAGKVIYAGAIDDKRSANPADIKGANNYVVAALTAARAGQPIANASTTPYGCSIKYQ